MPKGAKIMDYAYSYKMAFSVPMFVHNRMLRCLFLIISIIANLAMPIIKHVCLLFTVCIIQNMNHPFDTMFHNSTKSYLK